MKYNPEAQFLNFFTHKIFYRQNNTEIDNIKTCFLYISGDKYVLLCPANWVILVTDWTCDKC